MNKPSPKDDHKGCFIHDNVCIDEQMRAGCAVELFVCFNCRYMMLHYEGFAEDTRLMSEFWTEVFGD